MEEGNKFRLSIVEMFGMADYPVEKPLDLVPYLPDGLETTLDLEDGEDLRVMRLLERCDEDDFPVENSEELANMLEKKKD
ncbi:MAG: hypothetical protein H8Z69_05610 [Nanohaloarchaea archaeon]|nr:hypothetical protein [Candidatus Nanohaloarchaea archaeon]